MVKLSWDAPGTRLFQAGVDRGVLYPSGSPAAAWNGLLGVSQRPEGGVPEGYYAEGRKYQTVSSVEDYNGTIRAYTYPQEFEACDGSIAIMPGFLADQQYRKPFSLTYRTLIGNDTLGTGYGYQLHLIYNALVSPSTKDFETLGEDIEPQEFEWDFTTTPIVAAPNLRPSAHYVLDSTRVPEVVMQLIENRLYGTNDTSPSMIQIEEIFDIFNSEDTLTVIDNGDGSATIIGSDAEVRQLTSTEYQISSPAVTSMGDGESFSIRSAR